jgi:glycosyltransferase involved in cell wall biosynthesis
MCDQSNTMRSDKVTLLIKSFMRRDCVINLLRSIRQRYPTIPVVIVDDSEVPMTFDPDPYLRVYYLPFDSGLSRGRNHGVDQIDTDYFVLLDDDFEFTDDTKIEEFYRIIRNSDLDILGGQVIEDSGPINYFGNFTVDDEKREITNVRQYVDYGEYKTCQIILNFFMAKTKKIRKFRWDDELKVAEHAAFFFEHRDHLKVGFTDKVSVHHHQIRDEDYLKYRLRGKQFFNLWLKKKGIATYINFAGALHINPARSKLLTVGGSSSRISDIGRGKLTKRRLDKKQALENLILLDQILRQHRIPYWLTDGTLLGYYRDKDFITHDLDTDLGMMWHDFTPAALRDILRADFAIQHSFGYVENSFEISLIRNNTKTDLFFFYKKGKQFYHSAFFRELHRIDYVYEPFGIKEISFLGHKFFVPDDELKFIVTKYGETWATPIEEWDWAFSPRNHVITGEKINPEKAQKRFNKWLKS